jgi:hypothetical protein
MTFSIRVLQIILHVPLFLSYFFESLNSNFFEKKIKSCRQLGCHIDALAHCPSSYSYVIAAHVGAACMVPLQSCPLYAFRIRYLINPRLHAANSPVFHTGSLCVVESHARNLQSLHCISSNNVILRPAVVHSMPRQSSAYRRPHVLRATRNGTDGRSRR